MVYRLVIGVSLFALGYYLGREVGRTEPIREKLRRARSAKRPDNEREQQLVESDGDIQGKQNTSTAH